MILTCDWPGHNISQWQNNPRIDTSTDAKIINYSNRAVFSNRGDTDTVTIVCDRCDYKVTILTPGTSEG